MHICIVLFVVSISLLLDQVSGTASIVSPRDWEVVQTQGVQINYETETLNRYVLRIDGNVVLPLDQQEVGAITMSGMQEGIHSVDIVDKHDSNVVLARSHFVYLEPWQEHGERDWIMSCSRSGELKTKVEMLIEALNQASDQLTAAKP